MSSNTVERCTICQGLKKILGLGGIPKTCYNCEGLGVTQIVVAEEESIYNSVKPKKRGRSSRVMIDTLDECDTI